MDRDFERLFELQCRDALGIPLAELIIAPRFRAAYRALLRQAADGGAPMRAHRTSEFSVLAADGGELEVELSISRTRRQPPRVTTSVHVPDVAARASSGASGARAVQARVEELASIGSWELELATSELSWSHNMFRLLGLEPGAVAPSFDYLAAHAHPRDAARVQRARKELQRNGTMHPLRFRYVLPDGRVRHMHALCGPPAGARGERTRSGTLQDLTEQRVAEQELAARFAVTDLLANWEPGEAGLRRLLCELAEPLDFDAGALWVRHGDARIVRATWQAPALARPELERSMREARRPLHAGLVGAAWTTRRPVVAAAPGNAMVAAARQDNGPERPHRSERLRGALALPATCGEEVLAVLSFASCDAVELGERLTRSLSAVGSEIGQFFARRRSELTAAPLTPRELEVLQLVAGGGSRSEVAERLNVSESTIKTHLEHIYEKLEAHDRAAAVGAAMRQGLIA
jgi:DNA-binding CsgD family transcriptional regulator/PAS domain-containing protein